MPRKAGVSWSDGSGGTCFCFLLVLINCLLRGFFPESCLDDALGILDEQND